MVIDVEKAIFIVGKTIPWTGVVWVLASRFIGINNKYLLSAYQAKILL